MAPIIEQMMPGARVHYVRNSSGDPDHPRTCRGALVTVVHFTYFPSSIDLVVFDREGFRFKLDVHYDGTLDGRGPAPGTWHWPDPETARCTAVSGQREL